MVTKDNPQRKGKGIARGCLVALLALVVVLAVGMAIFWSFISREHHEAASLPLDAVDFARLSDGTYHGVYEGGMYRWRANACDVTVKDGKVASIRLVDGKYPGVEMLYDRVIKAQSLQVDTISGATLTSKAFLKCVENALTQAERK